MRKTASILAATLLMVSGSALTNDLPVADSVLVDKSERKLYLLKEGRPFREYEIIMGENPKGHKKMVGDERTPEGSYILDWRNPESNFYKSIHISYPSQRDLTSAKARGVDPGGMIMIHGFPNNMDWAKPILKDWNWTDGCIAVSNQEMDEIWLAVRDGTPIKIIP